MNDSNWNTRAGRRHGWLPRCLLGALAAFSGGPALTAATIDPQLAETLGRDEPTDFFVVLAEPASLASADQRQGKAAKGRFVLDTLRQHADATQRTVRAELDADGIGYRSFYIANAIYVAQGDRPLAERLAARPDVAAIVPNRSVRIDPPQPGDDEPAPASQAIESSLRFIRADQAWALGVEGDGLVIGGIDTGLQWDHPAILRQYRGWNGTAVDHNHHWWDATGQYPDAPSDRHGHGTHTTGTLVGDDGRDNRIGVAPRARTLHCKGLNDAGTGDDLAFLTCFQFMLAPWNLDGSDPRPELAPDVINNSWGYRRGNHPVFRDAIAALRAAGILVEVSAGNEGPGCGTLDSPGDYAGVLTTGSVGLGTGALPGVLTLGSSRGPSTLQPGAYVPGIMAPGEHIRSAIPGGSYARWSGTSMAGPHVSAAVGLMWQANPGLRGEVALTEQLIYDTAVPLTGQTGSGCGGNYGDGPNNDWGHGTLDALAAVQAAIALAGASGTLQGTVTDAVSDRPLAGASVTVGTFVVRTDAAGTYRITPNAGVYAATAARAGYAPLTIATTEVGAGTTTTLDFALHGAQLTVTPASIEQTVPPGTVVTRRITLSNAGPAPADFTVRITGHDAQRPSAVSIPRFTGTLEPLDQALSTDLPPPGTRGASRPGEAVFPLPLSGARALALNVYPERHLVEIPDIDRPAHWNPIAGLVGAPYAGDFLGGDSSTLYTLDYNDNILRTIDVATGARTTIGPTAPLGRWSGMSSAPDGTLYAVANGVGPTGGLSTLYTIDPATAALTMIGSTHDAPMIFDIAFDADGTLYAIDLLVRSLFRLDPATAQATRIGPLGVNANFAQSIAFHRPTGILYWAAYAGGGQLRVIDTQTGASMQVGTFPDDVQVAVLAFENDGTGPWASADPRTGTVPAGGSTYLDVRLDATAVAQPGTYTARLELPDAFGQGPAPVPLTMHVGCPGCGRIAGRVSDAEHGTPVAATIRIADAQIAFEATGTDFAVDLPPGTYSATVSADGYFDQTRTLTLAAGGITPADFALVRQVARLTYSPAAIEETLAIGGQASVPVTVTNTGTIPLTFRAAVGSVEGPRHLPRTQPIESASFSAPAALGPASLRSGAPMQTVPTGGWIAAAALPAGLARYGHAQCPGDPDRYYVVGGIENGEYSRATRRYDAASDSWTTLTPLPSGIGGGEGIALACHAGHLYAAGGDGTNRFLVYDIAADAWAAGPALPRGVWGAAIGAYDGRIHVAGGAPGFAFGHVSRDVDVFDIQAGTWGAGTPMPGGTVASGYAQVGRHLYVVGGWGVGSPATNVDRTQRYDLVTGQWETGPAFASARADFALAATGTRLYAIGGDTSGGDLYEASGQVEVLDHAAWPVGGWTDLGPPLMPLTALGGGYCTQAFAGGEVWAVGGVDAGLGFLTANRYRPAEACFTETAWISVDGDERTLAPGASTAIAVRFDAREFRQPGTYTAELRFQSTAADPVAPLPVTLQLVCSTCGRLAGTVTDAESGGAVAASIRVTADGGVSTGAVGSDYAIDLPPGPYAVQVSAPGYLDAHADVTVTGGATVTADFALLRQYADVSYAPVAISESLPIGAAATRTVTVTNAGTVPVELDLAVGSFIAPQRNAAAGEAAGRGEWLYRDALGTPPPDGDPAARLHPGAYRWTPDQPLAGAPRVLVYADDIVHRAPATYLDRALQALGWGYTAHYDGDFAGFVSALASGGWDLVLVGHETMPISPAAVSALHAHVRAGGKLVMHSNGIDASPLWPSLGVADFTTVYNPPAPIHWWEPAHGVFNRPQTVPALLAPASGVYAINGYRFTAAPGATAIAGYTPAGPAAGEAALLIGNDGRTVLKGFNDGSHSADLDGDGMPDAVELWINLIANSENGYGGSWASVEPARLTVPAGGSASFAVRLDTADLTDTGTYTAAVRITSNLGVPLPALPLTLDLRCAGCTGGVADLGIGGMALPSRAAIGGRVHLLATVGNFGPDAAGDVAVTIALPPELVFLSGRWIDGVPRGGGDWTCAPQGGEVRCALAGATLPVNALAAMLEVDVGIGTSARPGPVEAVLKVRAAQDDPNSANDRATLRLMLDYAADERVFADGFEGVGSP